MNMFFLFLSVTYLLFTVYMRLVTVIVYLRSHSIRLSVPPAAAGPVAALSALFSKSREDASGITNHATRSADCWQNTVLQVPYTVVH